MAMATAMAMALALALAMMGDDFQVALNPRDWDGPTRSD